jgi:type VI secretion system ImpA family protein
MKQIWSQLPDIDRAALLRPISRKAPCGASPRDSGVSDPIRRLRQQGHGKPEETDWAGIEEACLAALAGRTRDLEIAAWLTEALLYRRGAAGLAAGLDLIAGYAERFWDRLHPLPEGDDLAYRLAPLDWLDRLSVPARLIPLTAPSEPGVPPHGLHDWEMAGHLAQLARSDPKRHQRERQAGAVAAEEIELSLMLTPDGFLRTQAALFAAAASRLADLSALLEEKGADGFSGLPSLSRTIAACRHFLDSALAARPGGAVEMEEEAAESDIPSSSSPTLALSVPEEGSFVDIRNREEAYRLLALAADYLMRAEPHSPAPYLVRRAIAWGGMSLPQLLTELLDGDTDIARLRRLLGLP